MTPQEYALQAVKGIKKDFDSMSRFSIEKYADNRIFSLYETDEVFEIYTSTEGMSGSKKLGDAETPPVNELGEGYSVTIEEERFGGAIEILERTYRRDAKDSSMKVDNFIAKKTSAILQNNRNLFLQTAFTPLNEAFSSSSDYLAPDGVELLGAHSWNSSSETFDNGVVAILSEDSIDAMRAFGGAFTDAEGVPMPIDYDTIIVKKGSTASKVAIKQFAEGISPTKIADINIYEGTFTVIETPWITNALNWFAVDSKLDNPYKVGVGEYPTMREPQLQKNEAIHTNCTGFFKVGIVDMPYAWYGSTGAGA